MIGSLTLLVLIGLASGMSFGSYVSETQKEVDGRSAEFSINVMNLGQEDLTVSLSSRNSDSGTVTSPSEIPLQPSEVTSDPDTGLDEDEEWLLLANGKYVKTKKIPVVFVADEGSQHEFTVDLDAEVTGSPIQPSPGSDYSTAQKVVQSRSYRFEVSTSGVPGEADQDQESPGNDNPQSSSETTDDSSFSSAASGIVDGARDFLGQDSDSEQEEAGEEDQQQTEDDGESQSTQTEETTPETGEDDESSETPGSQATGGFFAQTAANPVTATLLVGMMASVGYLMMVIAG